MPYTAINAVLFGDICVKWADFININPQQQLKQLHGTKF